MGFGILSGQHTANRSLHKSYDAVTLYQMVSSTTASRGNLYTVLTHLHLLCMLHAAGAAESNHGQCPGAAPAVGSRKHGTGLAPAAVSRPQQQPITTAAAGSYIRLVANSGDVAGLQHQHSTGLRAHAVHPQAAGAPLVWQWGSEAWQLQFIAGACVPALLPQVHTIILHACVQLWISCTCIKFACWVLSDSRGQI